MTTAVTFVPRSAASTETRRCRSAGNWQRSLHIGGRSAYDSDLKIGYERTK